MQIACPACQTRYSVPDGAIPAEGRTVRCAKCRHSWFEKGDGAEAAADDFATPVAPPAPTSGGWDEAAPEPQAPQPEPDFARPGTRTAPPEPEPEPETFAGQPDSSPASPYAQARPFDGGMGYLGPMGARPAEAPVPHGETTPTTPGAWSDENEDRQPLEQPAAEPPLAEPEPEPAPAPIRVEPMAADEATLDEAVAVEEWEDEPAPRRSRLRLILVVILVLLAVAAAAFAAVRYYGAPAWLPVGQVAFAPASENLELDFPADKQDRRTLPNGLQFFAASGTVTNIGKATERVPDVQVVLRDAQDRIVYTWELEPPKREIAPGETVSINEAVTDVPASARLVEIGWKAG